MVGVQVTGTSALGDRRLSKRLERVVETLAEHPGQSIAHACGSWAATLATYRLLDNEEVTPAAVVASLAAATLARGTGHERVVVVQDTSSVDYTGHPATANLGVLENPVCRGLFVHTSLAVTPAGVPLGVLAQQIWARPTPVPDPTDHRRHHLPLEGKESAKWVRDWNTTATALQAQGSTPILVADQEADIYEVYATAAALESAFVIRARHDRAVVDQTDRMVAAVARTPCAFATTVAVARADGHPGRTARLHGRYLPLTVAAPDQATEAIAQWWAEHPDTQRLTPAPRRPLALTVLLVTEVDPPTGVTPLRWLLVTNLAVASPTDALEIVATYRLRWLVERFHFVLKRGCRIEDLQLRTADRLMRAIAVYSGVAWRLLWLTYEARQVPDRPCTGIVDDATWQALWAVQQPTRSLPPTPPTVREFIRQVARLGGFLGRR